jgi:diadenylate cyclase
MFYLFVIIPIIEVLIIAIAINYLLSFFWNSKSMGLIWCIFAFAIILVIVTYLHLPVLNKIMIQIGSSAFISFIIIFHPELRSALSKLNFKVFRNKEISEFDAFLDNLSNSIYRLSEKRIGALIAIETEDSLEEFAQKAVVLKAVFSSELLETIFATTTPLHDGAVIIREGKILSAACILPLVEDNSQLAKSMGTRHRAALGLSNMTDALIIVVSEESGKISIAKEGLMSRGIKIERLKGIVRSTLNPLEDITFQSKFNFREWITK